MWKWTVTSLVRLKGREHRTVGHREKYRIVRIYRETFPDKLPPEKVLWYAHDSNFQQPSLGGSSTECSMKISELHAALQAAMVRGFGDAPVYFDAEARTFHVHEVEVDNAVLEDVVGVDMGVPVYLNLSTRYHAYPPHIVNACDCSRVPQKSVETSIQEQVDFVSSTDE